MTYFTSTDAIQNTVLSIGSLFHVTKTQNTTQKKTNHINKR